MTEAIAIVGGLALIFSSFSIVLLYAASTGNDYPDKRMAIGIIGATLFYLGWLLTTILYVLALCKNPALAIILVGALAIFAPLPGLRSTSRKLFIGNILGLGCTIALFFLALVK